MLVTGALGVTGSVAMAPVAAAADGYTLFGDSTRRDLPAYTIKLTSSTLEPLRAHFQNAINQIHAQTPTRLTLAAGVQAATGGRGEIAVYSGATGAGCGDPAYWDACAGPQALSSEGGYTYITHSKMWFQMAKITPDPVAYQQSLVAHELGHALGLDHHRDGVVLMDPTVSSADGGTFKAGDVRGLNYLARCSTSCGSDPSRSASGDVFAIHRNDRDRTAIHGLDNQGNFQRFAIQTLTGMHSTVDPARYEHRVADFNADGVADLYVFDRQDGGQIAVHVLNGADNYQSFLAHRRMQLPGISRIKLDAADYNGDGRAEVYAFDTDDNGRTAIHVLDAASHFGTFLMQTRSAQAESTSSVWSFAAADYNGDRKADVYAFHGADTGRTAVHVLDAASSFQSYLIHTRTALPAVHGTSWVLDAGDFDGDGRADIYGLNPVDQDRTAVHVLSPTTNFQSFTMQTRSALPNTIDPLWSLSVVP